MTTSQTDPRVAQALHLIVNVGEMLSRAERIIRTTEPSRIPNFDRVVTSLRQAQHSLALAWNAALANVPEPRPTPPPPPPSVPSAAYREISARGHDTPESHAQRARDGDAVARSIRIER